MQKGEWFFCDKLIAANTIVLGQSVDSFKQLLWWVEHIA